MSNNKIMPGFRLVDCPVGTFLLNKDNYIDREIITNGSYEKEQLERFCTLIQENNISQFIDIGANIGLYTVKIGRMQTVNTIHAFEPILINRSQLHANVLLNNLTDKVKIWPYALSKNAEVFKFLKNKGDSTGISRIKTGDEDSIFLERFEEIEIQTQKLDDLISSEAIKIAIKIDVEGHELDVLSGMAELLSKNTCILQIESFVDKRTKVRDILTYYGYNMIHAIGNDYYYSNFREHSNSIDFEENIKCYVINLDRSTDRQKYINRIFGEKGLVFERVAAKDGTLLTDQEFDRLTSKRKWLYELTRNEVGCFLSHRECLHRIIENDVPWGAIFEDDIILSQDICSLLKDVSWIPEGTDIIKLDTAETICMVEHTRPIIHHNHVHSTAQHSTAQHSTAQHSRLGRLVSNHYCAGGYIISKQCAKKLYELTEYVSAPIDEIYFHPDYGLLRELNVQQIIPAVVIQRSGMESTIEEERKLKRKEVEKKKRVKRSLSSRILREIQRAYTRRILSPWLALTRGYCIGKIRFK